MSKRCKGSSYAGSCASAHPAYSINHKTNQERNHIMSKRCKEREFFTLIELLIVIAMIAILLHSKSGFFMANYGRSAF